LRTQLNRHTHLPANAREFALAYSGGEGWGEEVVIFCNRRSFRIWRSIIEGAPLPVSLPKNLKIGSLIAKHLHRWRFMGSKSKISFSGKSLPASATRGEGEHWHALTEWVCKAVDAGWKLEVLGMG